MIPGRSVRAHPVPGVLLAILFAVALGSGCTHLPKSLPKSGPSVEAIEQAGREARANGIELVPITEQVVRSIRARREVDSFAASLGDARPRGQRAGAGDAIEISVWEAPPAMLFGVTASDPRLLAGTAIVTHLPVQVVDADGTVTVPFAGRLAVAGKTPREIEQLVAAQLKGKTNQIQVLVRVAQNVSANVSVVGEVRSSVRVGLTPAGERLLDVLAAAGGVSQPVSKMTLQITRGQQIRAMPMEAIVRDPSQNVVMEAGDIVTALFQPYTFMALGAAGTNAEVPFEAGGLSLAQALARAGGVNDNRADRRGVFVFRFEDSKAVDWGGPVSIDADGRVPVVYQLDLDNAASLLVAQRFPIRDKDVLYISTAPAAELQKFLQIVSSIATPVLAVRALTR